MFLPVQNECEGASEKNLRVHGGEKILQKTPRCFLTLLLSFPSHLVHCLCPVQFCRRLHSRLWVAVRPHPSLFAPKPLCLCRCLICADPSVGEGMPVGIPVGSMLPTRPRRSGWLLRPW